MFKKNIITVLSLAIPLLVTGCASNNSQTKNGPATQYMEDTTITTRVKTDIINDPHIHSFISVSTTDRVVTLSGTVRNLQERRRAIAIARKTPNVFSVKDAIIVETHSRNE